MIRGVAVLLAVLAAVSCLPFDSFEQNESQNGPNRRPMFPFPGFPHESDSGSEEDFDYGSQLDKMHHLLDLFRQLINMTGNVNNYPPNYHNSTSTSQVVNGSVVTVNETIDKVTDDNNNTYFIEQEVIDVQNPNATEPQVSESTTTEFANQFELSGSSSSNPVAVEGSTQQQPADGQSPSANEVKNIFTR